MCAAGVAFLTCLARQVEPKALSPLDELRAELAAVPVESPSVGKVAGVDVQAVLVADVVTVAPDAVDAPKAAQ